MATLSDERDVHVGEVYTTVEMDVEAEWWFENASDNEKADMQSQLGCSVPSEFFSAYDGDWNEMFDDIFRTYQAHHRRINFEEGTNARRGFALMLYTDFIGWLEEHEGFELEEGETITVHRVETVIQPNPPAQPPARSPSGLPAFPFLMSMLSQMEQEAFEALPPAVTDKLREMLNAQPVEVQSQTNCSDELQLIIQNLPADGRVEPSLVEEMKLLA